jgi:hypothetical protein
VCENISTCLPASRARLLVRREIFFRCNSVVSLRPPMLHERTREGKVRSTLRRQRCLLHKRVSTDRFPPIDSADREHQILCFPLKSLLPHIVVHDRCGRTNLCSILVYSRTLFFSGAACDSQGPVPKRPRLLLSSRKYQPKLQQKYYPPKPRHQRNKQGRTDSVHDTPVFPHSIFTE